MAACSRLQLLFVGRSSLFLRITWRCALCTSSLFARAVSWSLALCPTFHNPLLAGHPPVAFSGSTARAKYSRLSFDAGCTKGPGGTETRMAATRPAIGSAGSHLLCSKASDIFFSAPRRQANRGAGKTSTESRRPSKMTESSPPQLGLFGDPQIPENEQGHIALASAHQLLLMGSNSCVLCVTHRSRWTY